MSRRQGRNASIVYGICTNTGTKDDGTPACTKCQNKERQAIRASKDFVCEECGEPLKKVPAPSPNPVPLIVAVVVVIAAAIGAWFGFRGHNEAGSGDIVDTIDTMSQVVNPAPSGTTKEADTSYTKDSDEIEKPVSSERSENGNRKSSPSSHEKEAAYDLGWGTYTGPMKNGKPDGSYGKIKVTSTYLIDLGSSDGTRVVVYPGETIVSNFVNGRLRSGEVLRKNGSSDLFSVF